MTVDNQVRRWLLTFPGLFEADTPAEVLEKARTASGVDCSIAEFAAALSRYGFRVDQVRGRVRLALPMLSVNATGR